MALLFVGVWYAQVDRRGEFGDDPDRILDNVVAEVSEGAENAQDTELNRVNRVEWWYPARFTISNTLDSLRTRLNPYLQWLVYIGLAAATIFIIYNWFLLVTWSLHTSGEWSAVQKKLINVIIWVLLLTGFYFVIRLLVILVNSLTSLGLAWKLLKMRIGFWLIRFMI